MPIFNELPKEGIPKQEILELLSKILNKENNKWEKGFVSGAVYHGEKDHIDFLNNVYAIKKDFKNLRLIYNRC